MGGRKGIGMGGRIGVGISGRIQIGLGGRIKSESANPTIAAGYFWGHHCEAHCARRAQAGLWAPPGFGRA